MKVSVFGGSHPITGDPEYEQAYDLGRSLARADHVVLTGGYIGTMEAVSRGAAEAGGHVIGVTCEEIEAWRKVKPNRWVMEEHRYATLQERLHELIYGCDAAIALPGGPGTLTEIALTWNLMVIQAVPVKPLLLVGAGWGAVIKILFDSFPENISKTQRSLLIFAPDILAAIDILTGKPE